MNATIQIDGVLAHRKDQLEKFMRESNAIEGEFDVLAGKAHGKYQGMLFEHDIEAAERFLDEPMTELTLKRLHSDLSVGRPILRGDWRKCQVYVGGYTPPPPRELNRLMNHYFNDLPKMTAWEAHCKFEMIHPFEDLNGRTGRLIWLHKMGGESRLSFLQGFYYQTLNAFQQEKQSDPKRYFKNYI